MLIAALQCMAYECALLFSHTAALLGLHWLLGLLGTNEKVGVWILFTLTFMSMINLDVHFIYTIHPYKFFAVTMARCATDLAWFLLVSYLLNVYCEIRLVIKSNDMFIICPWDYPNDPSHLGGFILIFYAVALGRSIITFIEVILYIVARIWRATRP